MDIEDIMRVDNITVLEKKKEKKNFFFKEEEGIRDKGM